MWPTTDGLRKLKGAEADLVRGAIGMLLDQLVAEGRGEMLQHEYNIDWFDNWEYEQRIWLVEQVAFALLTDESAVPAAAMFEATVDAVFAEIADLVVMEIDEPTTGKRSWRQNIQDAFESQTKRKPDIQSDCTDMKLWNRVITQVADAILGVRLYQQAEAFRDGDIDRTSKFLQQKGLPDDFLEQIPPLKTVSETQVIVDRLQRLVF